MNRAGVAVALTVAIAVLVLAAWFLVRYLLSFLALRLYRAARRSPGASLPWKGPTRMDALLAIGGLGILAVVGILSAVAYVVMVDVKPKEPRPVLDEAARRQIDDLGNRLIKHVTVLAGEIGERNLFRPQGLRAAAEYIRQSWTAQGFPVAEEPFEAPPVSVWYWNLMSLEPS